MIKFNNALERLFIIFYLLINLPQVPAAQTVYDKWDFTGADSVAATVKYRHNIIKLAEDLGRPFSKDIFKARAIFRWITNNIAYDYRFINKGDDLERPDCGDRFDCPTILYKWENDYLERILKKKRAIADGYAKLFKRLCELNYIQSEVIPGYARTRPYQVGNSMGVNHAWNAVLIDTAWYYVDAAWAAGDIVEDEETGLLVGFEKNYHNYYWLSSFERFSRNHYPQTNKWVVKPNFSKEQFFNKPHYFSIEVLENLWEESPVTGVLKVKKGDSILFRFTYKKDIRKLQVNSNNFRNPSLYTMVKVSRKKWEKVRDEWAEKKQVYIPYRRDGETYSFYYVVTEASLYYLELVFDYKPAIRYRVRVER